MLNDLTTLQWTLLIVAGIAGCIHLLYSTWIHYLALMNLRKNKDNLTKAAKIFGYPMLFRGAILDILLNAIIGTAVFMEWPREFLFTTRCNRHLKSKNWRGSRARWWCRNFLDPFDKGGKHCG